MIGRDRPDLWLLASMTVVLAIGMATIFSASTVISEEGLFQKQLIWSGIGVLAFVFGTMLSFRRAS